MPLICVGGSHVMAISKGAALMGKHLVEFRLTEMKRADKISGKALQKQVGERLAAAVRQHGAKAVFCFCGGGMHAAIGLVQHPQRFDFVMPDQPDLPFDSNATLVPFTAVQTLMADKVRRHLRTLGHFAQAVPAKLVQFEPPPPIADEAFLKEAAVRYDGSVKTYGISSLHLRFKLWRLHSQLFRNYCEKHDIIYVDNPPEVFDEAGCFAQRYWGDFVHGNAEYGALILEKAESLRL